MDSSKPLTTLDPSFDVRFSTYAVPMIVGEIRRYLRDNNALRVSRSVRDVAYKAMQAREALTSQLLREPTPAEIAARTGLDERAVVEALGAIVEPVSLYEPGLCRRRRPDLCDGPAGRRQPATGTGWTRWPFGNPLPVSVTENGASWPYGFWVVTLRWRWLARSASPRHRSAVWRKNAIQKIKKNL